VRCVARRLLGSDGRTFVGLVVFRSRVANPERRFTFGEWLATRDVVGGLDTVRWTSTGISYTVELDSPASAADLAQLLAVVDEVAEIPLRDSRGCSC
jgi:hypothetical protein